MACKTVVVIDPDLTIASFIKKSILAFDPSASVILFSSFLEIQPLLQSSPIDCLIMDSSCAYEDENDNLELIEPILSADKIVITGYPSGLMSLPQHYQTGYALVHKPLDANRLSQVLKSIIGSVNLEILQQVSLDPDQFRFCQGVARKLRNQLGARMVLLSDTVGRILVSAGEAPDTTHDLICSLLGGSIASLIEASRSLEDQDIVQLVFREGNETDLYAISIGRQLLLIILINKSEGFARMGTTWYYGRQCAIHLDRYFSITSARNDQKPIFSDSVSDITAELDKLFNY